MMVSSWVSFSISGRGFDEASASLKTVEEEFPGWVRRDINKEANTLMLRAGARLQTMEVHGAKHRGLRASIVRGMKVEDVRDGSRVTVSVPSNDEALLPRLLDAGLQPKGWKHPVFGRGQVWEVGNVAWFSDTMDDARSETEDMIQADADKAEKLIQGR